MKWHVLVGAKALGEMLGSPFHSWGMRISVGEGESCSQKGCLSINFLYTMYIKCTAACGWTVTWVKRNGRIGKMQYGTIDVNYSSLNPLVLDQPRTNNHRHPKIPPGTGK